MLTITIEEYQSLKADSDFLHALIEAGVDNWEGYGMACEIYDGELDPEDI